MFLHALLLTHSGSRPFRTGLPGGVGEEANARGGGEGQEPPASSHLLLRPWRHWQRHRPRQARGLWHRSPPSPTRTGKGILSWLLLAFLQKQFAKVDVSWYYLFQHCKCHTLGRSEARWSVAMIYFIKRCTAGHWFKCFSQDTQVSQDSKASRSGPSEDSTVSSSTSSTEAAGSSPKLEELAEVQKEAPSSTSPIDLSTKKSSEPDSSPAAAASGPVKTSQGTHTSKSNCFSYSMTKKKSICSSHWVTGH